MGWFDSISEGIAAGVDWLGDNSDGLTTAFGLGAGAYSLYQGSQAGETATQLYDTTQEMAEDKWDMFKPLEQARIDKELNDIERTTTLQNQSYDWQEESMDQQRSLSTLINEANEQLIPLQSDMAIELLNFQKMALPQQQDLYRKYMNIDAGNKDLELQNQEFQRQNLPQEQDLYRQSLAFAGKNMDYQNQNLDVQSSMLQSQQGDIDQYEKWRPIEDEYYRQSMEGIDPQAEANKASADVASAFAGSMDAANRELARMGVSPDSGSYSSRNQRNAMDRARALGTAKTGARQYAEDVNYNRLGSALNARQRLAPASSSNVFMPNIPSSAPTSVTQPTATLAQTELMNNPNQPTNYGTINAGSYDPTNTFTALANTAAQGANASTNTGWDLIMRGLDD